LKAHASVKVHTGSGKDTSKNLYWGSTSYIWNNDGDTATLDNANGVKVDSCTYSGSGSRATC
jgi:Lamin Tail Domain